VTLAVDANRGAGDYLLTLVGSVTGTKSMYVSVNGGAPQLATITSYSDSSPLLGRSLQVRLRPHANTIRFFNDTAYAPDLDRITVSPLC
jgi:hypothetical protein